MPKRETGRNQKMCVSAASFSIAPGRRPGKVVTSNLILHSLGAAFINLLFIFFIQLTSWQAQLQFLVLTAFSFSFQSLSIVQMLLSDNLPTRTQKWLISSTVQQADHSLVPSSVPSHLVIQRLSLRPWQFPSCPGHRVKLSQVYFKNAEAGDFYTLTTITHQVMASGWKTGSDPQISLTPAVPTINHFIIVFFFAKHVK